MKAEEILERHLRVSSAIPLSTLQKHFVLIAMEEYAQQLQSPQISEEEIFAYIKEKRDEILKPKGANMTIGEMRLGELTWTNICIDVAKHFLSRLPHEQPVNNTYKLEAEQPKEENNADDKCYHECPVCGNRCNCSDQPCSCCGVREETEQIKDIAKMTEEIACNFAEYLYNNRWFSLENGKWHYCFEQGTAIGKENYAKYYIKTTRELFVKFIVQMNNPSLPAK